MHGGQALCLALFEPGVMTGTCFDGGVGVRHRQQVERIIDLQLDGAEIPSKRPVEGKGIIEELILAWLRQELNRLNHAVFRLAVLLQIANSRALVDEEPCLTPLRQVKADPCCL